MNTPITFEKKYFHPRPNKGRNQHGQPSIEGELPNAPSKVGINFLPERESSEYRETVNGREQCTRDIAKQYPGRTVDRAADGDTHNQGNRCRYVDAGQQVEPLPSCEVGLVNGLQTVR